MKFDVVHQETYSRGQLLLRTFFGWLYIALPHYLVLTFLGLWSQILSFVSFWIILFTGKYPRKMFDYQEKFFRWYLRVYIRLLNLSDGYPAFGLNAEDDKLELKFDYPEKLSRGKLLLKGLFGFFYVLIPHYFTLLFRLFVTEILIFLAWFSVLFTGKYPESMHKFNVGTLRWAIRIILYYGLWITDEYPPFNGREDSSN